LQAVSNAEISTRLETLGANDWAVTTLFYSAVHWIDAYLEVGGQIRHPKDHGERYREIRGNGFLRGLYPAYRELDDRSRDARYECAAFSSANVLHLRGLLVRIESAVRVQLHI